MNDLEDTNALCILCGEDLSSYVMRQAATAHIEGLVCATCVHRLNEPETEDDQPT